MAQPTERLIRAIGVRQLAASIVNTTIGAGIFVIPALVAQQLGAAAPLAYLLCAAAMALIVTTFAMAGSRVAMTGGLFAYVETAFGPYVGFLAGTFQWLTLTLGASGVAIALLDVLSLVVPVLRNPVVRPAVLAVVLGTFAAINVRGVRTGARTVELLTVAKLVPLAGFVIAGAFAVEPSALAWPGMPDTTSLGRGVLLLSFAFMGIEVALTPSGEVENPASTVPRAVYAALAITSIVYVAIQLVAQGVLGADLATHTQAPLADAAGRFLGPAAATLILAGTVISMLGYVSGDSLCSPRNLFAFGRDGFISARFARVDPVHRTPRLAIWTHAAIVFIVASSGSFESIVVLSNVSGFALYLLACVASLVLMHRDVRTEGLPFVPPGARLIAGASIAAVLLILSTATLKEFAATGAMAILASVLYLARRRAPEPSVGAV